MCLEKQKHLLCVIMIKQLSGATEHWGVAAGDILFIASLPPHTVENITAGLMQWALLRKQSIFALVINRLFVSIHGSLKRASFVSHQHVMFG